MPIKIQQPGMAGLYGAAAITAKLSKEQKEAQRQADAQMQMQFQQNMKQMDYRLGLEKYERAKRWEIDKMELASQIDFQREEQTRQRKLDGYDNALSQIDKEVQSGRITEKEAEPYRLKINLNKQGVNVSVSEIARQQEEDKYGVRPYYTDPDFERDFPELAEAKKKDIVEGRAGTIPYQLSPEFLRTLPSSVAQDMLVNKGIFFDSDEEFEAWLVNLESATPKGLPLGDKELDMGQRVDVNGEEVTVISPTGEEGTIPIEDLDEALAAGYTRIRAFRGAGATGTWEEPFVGPPAPKRKPMISLKRLMSKGFK